MKAITDTPADPPGLIPPSEGGGRWRVVSGDPFADPRLSLKAKGLHGFLTTRGPGWKIRPATLHVFSRDGKEATRAAFNELIAVGLVVGGPGRKGGRFSGSEYRSVRPEEEAWQGGYPPRTGFPDTVKPDTGEPAPGGQPLPSKEEPRKEGTEVRSAETAAERAEDVDKSTGRTGDGPSEGDDVTVDAGPNVQPSPATWGTWESTARGLARTGGNLAGFVVTVATTSGTLPPGGLDYAEAGRLCKAVGAVARKGEPTSPGMVATREARAAWIVQAMRGMVKAGRPSEAFPAMWQTIQATAATAGPAPDPAPPRPARPTPRPAGGDPASMASLLASMGHGGPTQPAE